MNKLEDLYNRYGKKIWLTEFAKCCTRNQAEVETFVKVWDATTFSKMYCIFFRPSFPGWRLLIMSTATHGSLLGIMRRISKLLMPVKQDPVMTGTWTRSMLSLLKIQLNYLLLVNCTMTFDLQNYTPGPDFISRTNYFDIHSKYNFASLMMCSLVKRW